MFFKDRSQCRGYAYSCKPCINITKLPSKRASWAKHKDRYNKEKREYFAHNRDVQTDRNMAKYGINLEIYNKMLKEQHGVCAICKALPPTNRKKRLEIDHCHATGQVRGLLCNKCNVMLGSAKDDIKIMEKGIKYLQSYGTI